MEIKFGTIRKLRDLTLFLLNIEICERGTVELGNSEGVGPVVSSHQFYMVAEGSITKDTEKSESYKSDFQGVYTSDGKEITDEGTSFTFYAGIGSRWVTPKGIVTYTHIDATYLIDNKEEYNQAVQRAAGDQAWVECTEDNDIIYDSEFTEALMSKLDS